MPLTCPHPSPGPLSQELNQQNAEKGLLSNMTFVDAPVSGGVGAAEAGALTFLVGGDEQSYQRAQEVLQHMSKAVFHCGKLPGSGQAVKLANNLALGISMSAISEAMLLGTRLGVDPKVLAAALNSATARCWSSDTYNPYPGVIETAPSSRGVCPWTCPQPTATLSSLPNPWRSAFPVAVIKNCTVLLNTNTQATPGSSVRP